MASTQPASSTRSPLKRAATAPLYNTAKPSSTPSAPSNETATSHGRSVRDSSPEVVGARSDNVKQAPAALHSMHAVLSRLSSQHHMSDYNRMKRLTATSQPMQASASHPLPPHSLWSTSTSSSSSHSPSVHSAPKPASSHSPSTLALPVRTSSLSTTTTGSSLSPSQNIDAYTIASSQSTGLSSSVYANQMDMLDNTKSNLIPPVAPDLLRTYTEEEGQNPHLHLGTSRGSISSIGLSTPALSMDSMPPSPPTSSLRSSSADTSVLSTPPDNESAANNSSSSISRSDIAAENARLSPTIAKKTVRDEKNDRELSERLLDAMEENGQMLMGGEIRTSEIPFGSARTQASQQRSASSRPASNTSSIRSSSIPVTGSHSTTSSSSKSSSHSISMHASSSSNMSRSSTTALSGAHASGTPASSAGMHSSLSALTDASNASHQRQHQAPKNNVVHIEETVITDTPYYINSNHPDLVGVKTSLTHPMNVSPLIPPELLPLYGQSILHAVPVSTTSYSNADVYSNHQNQRARSPLGKLTMHDLPPGSNLNNTTTTGARPPSPTKLTTSASGSSAMHISRPTTPANGSGEEKIYLHEVLDHVIDSGYMKKPFVIQPSADIHALTGPNASAALFNLTLPISQQLAMTSTLNSDGDYGSESSATMFTSGSAIRLGNLVLSSCPGKKVRLSDRHLEILGIPEICRPGIDPATQIPILDPRTLPKAGVTTVQQSLVINRSPICRDLELDLRRAIEQADIKAVVCCIDDEELKFLGAAWVEYEKVARRLDLEVIRLPMAEGFAPPSPEVLDAHLSTLITRYTLQGKNCLVHCRGGVGRAGLFACSWMIKLGLLGNIINIQDPNNRTLDNEMKIVEKVIQVIRKRRSAKAIETPQQVQFILQYIHWLACEGRSVTARQILKEANILAG